MRQDGRVVGEHRRVFGRGQTVYDPWHYVPVLARKPGALRNGAPFKDWVLPGALERVRRKVAKAPGRDEGMVLKMGGRYYHGADCIHALAMLSSNSDTFNRINAAIFRSPTLSRMLYPILRAGRNAVLRGLGRTTIRAGDV